MGDQDHRSHREEVLRLDRRLHPGFPLHLPADVDLQAGVRRVRPLHRPPQVLLSAHSPSSRCGSPSRSTTSAAPPSSTASASKRTLTLQPSAKRRGKQYTGSNRHHLHLLVSGVIPCFLFNHFSIIWPFG